MPLRAFMDRRRGERPGLPVRPLELPVVVLLIGAGVMLAGVGLLAVALVMWLRRS